MKLFIYEHLTSGALSGQDYSEELSREGDLMLKAISDDLIALGYTITTLRDRRLQNSPLNPQLNIIWVESVQAYQALWQQCIEQYDDFLLIAPETEGVLLKLQQQIIDAGKQFLGCDQASTQISSDKLACYQSLCHSQINTPHTSSQIQWLQTNQIEKMWVVKPIDGAGSEQTYIFSTGDTRQFLETLTDSIHYIVQSFIKGQSLSLSLFIETQQIHVLSINEQVMEQQGGQLHLKQCEPVNHTSFTMTDAVKLAETVHSAIPGLWGFVGIDLIWANGTSWVIEVNPRLTLSYTHPQLRAHHNPARYLHTYLQSKHQVFAS